METHTLDIQEPHREHNDCWNQIGVSGDATCPELQQVMHCHNCPVYATGGRQLLEREPPENYLHEWTQLLAQEKEEVRTADTISVLIFRLGKEWLALPTQICKEVAETRTIHSLPHRSGHILLGLVNMRGEIQMCIAFSQLLGLEQSDDASDTVNTKAYERLVVVERDRDRWVFLVDEIHGIIHFHPRALQNAPVTVAKATPAFTKGVIDWQGKGVGYLDPELLFSALNREVL